MLISVTSSRSSVRFVKTSMRCKKMFRFSRTINSLLLGSRKSWNQMRMWEYQFIYQDDLVGNTCALRQGLLSFHRGTHLSSVGIHSRVEKTHPSSNLWITQKSDVYACIYTTEIFDFLIDIIPASELQALRKTPSEGMMQILPTKETRENKWQ